MTLTTLETHWTSPEAKEMFEYLRTEIAKAMMVPEHLLDADYGTRQQFLDRAYRSTELARAIAMKLFSQNTTMVMVTKEPT